MRVKTMAGALVFFCVVIALFVYTSTELLGTTIPDAFGWSSEAYKTAKFVTLCILIGIVVIGILAEVCLHAGARNAIHKQWGVNDPQQLEFVAQAVKEANPYTDIKDRLKSRLGPGWGRKTRILLIAGEEDQVEKLLPGLIAQRWVEGAASLLLWVGPTGELTASTYIKMLPQLRGYRPADALVWVTDDNAIAQPHVVDTAIRNFHHLYETVGWKLPIYIWDMQSSQWEQRERQLQSVDCFFPSKISVDIIAASLNELIAPLRHRGIQQLSKNISHDFLLRLSHQLSTGGVASLSTALGACYRYISPVKFAGMLFSLPSLTSASYPHSWITDARWTQLLADVRTYPAERTGIQWGKGGAYLVSGLMAIWLVGAAVTFTINRHTILTTTTLLSTAENPGVSLRDRLESQYSLQQQMSTLLLTGATSASLSSFFGLNVDADLLSALIRRYPAINQTYVLGTASKGLHQQLQAVVDNPTTTTRWQQKYDVLKAYLMLSHPDKVDTAFLSGMLKAQLPPADGIPDKEWDRVASSLTHFYASQLKMRPDWAFPVDTALIKNARSVLLAQLAGQNSDEALYVSLIQNATRQFPDLTLADLSGSGDAEGLFSTSRSVKGAYSREAWDTVILPELEQLKHKRTEQIGWVLSDGGLPATGELSPEAVTARLKERYFTDFASQWSQFLNSLRWQKAPALSATLKQLGTLTDARRSPLIQLMDKLASQLQTGATPVIPPADSLVYKGPTSYRKARLAPKWQLPDPMLKSFGPVLGFMGIQVVGNDVSRWTFKSYLSQVSRLQQKLQQVSQSTDPRIQAEGLGQTVLKGSAIDLPNSKAFVEQMNLSVGKTLKPFGDALFLSPMNLSWKQVLTPSGAQMNKQWRDEIASKWRTQFSQTYPFVDSKTDLSIHSLTEFIRPDSGLIDQFISNNLQGVLRKASGRWIPDSAVKGLSFNPAFISALNRLNQLSDALYRNGGERIEFDLLPVPSRDVVQTELKIDGQSLVYFNQMQTWQHFTWPGDIWTPYSELVWTSVRAGARIYYSAEGRLTFIRLLDGAKVTQLGPQHYSIVLTAPDGLLLQYQMKTAEGKGPLAFLDLKGFVLPDRIFNTK